MTRFFLTFIVFLLMTAQQSFAQGDLNKPMPNDVVGTVSGDMPPGAAPLPVETQQSSPDMAVINSDRVDEPVSEQTDPGCGDYHEWVGKKITEDQAAAVSKNYRIIRPGTSQNHMYMFGRVNFVVDEHDIVTDVHCG